MGIGLPRLLWVGSGLTLAGILGCLLALGIGLCRLLWVGGCGLALAGIFGNLLALGIGLPRLLWVGEGGGLALGIGLRHLLLDGGCCLMLTGILGGALALGIERGGFALIRFQDLCSALIERLPATKLGQCPLGLEPILLAVLAEVISDVRHQRRGPLNGGIFELAANAGGTQGSVPIGMNRRCGEV